VPPALPETTALHVASETAPLRQVVVHTPGDEMALVSPANKDALLFDDILFLDQAREEHAAMVRLFEKVVGAEGAVLQLAALIRETFDAEDARHDYVACLAAALPERNYEPYVRDLQGLDPDDLFRFAVTGQNPFGVSAHPLPNLLFTRDLCAVVGDHVILSHAAREARLPESVLVSVVLRHHPRFADARKRLVEVPSHVSFEGGDLLVASEEVVLLGHSERTSLDGVLAVTRALFERTAVRHVLVVNLPKRRACMHLDTVFTFADDETCVVYPPIIEAARDYVFHVEADGTDGAFRLRVLPNLRVALRELMGRAYTFVPCGGADPLAQEREQWTDGANLFALRPGLVVGYERNRRTFDALRERGFHVTEAENLLEFYGEEAIEDGARIAVKLPGYELSRGRGGPRCMTMPLVGD
jgi:arginine deiminase